MRYQNEKTRQIRTCYSEEVRLARERFKKRKTRRSRDFDNGTRTEPNKHGATFCSLISSESTVNHSAEYPAAGQCISTKPTVA
jgi:hypothetical protein